VKIIRLLNYSNINQGLGMGFPWFKPVSTKNDIDDTEHTVAPTQIQPLIDIKLPQFKYFTDSNELTVPFKITEAGLKEWFIGLNPNTECYFSCRQIFRSLKALNAREIPPALRFALLNFIGAAIVPIVRSLEQPILERKISLTAEARQHHELLVATYAALAQGFSLVAKEVAAERITKHSEQLLVRSLFAAMETLKKVLLYNAEVYEKPYEGFWSSCYRLYRCAEQHDLLDLNVKDATIKDDTSAGYSLDFSFKSLLVFYLSGLNQYKPKTMKTLLKVFMIWAPYAKIYKKIDALNSKLFFAFSLDGDAPPAFLPNLVKRNNDIRYLSTTEIAKIVYDNLRNETAALLDIHTMKRQELVQLVKNLSMGSRRKFIRVPEKKYSSGIVGYNNILRFLRNPAGGGEDRGIESHDPRIAGSWKVPDLELLPLIDYEKELGSKGWAKVADDSGTHVEEQPVWNPHGDEQAIKFDKSDKQAGKFDKLEIINRSIKGYGMVYTESHAKAEIGEFIGILVGDCGDQSRLEIGIIRRITQEAPNCVSLGVELFSSSAEAVFIYRPGNALLKRQAVLLHGIKGIKQPESLIYDTQGFSLGDEVCMVQGDDTVHARIAKILHASTTLRHVELQIRRED
jgi:hypothetical protein